MDPLAAPCISRSITWGSQASAREGLERLSDERAWRVARGGTKSPLYDCTWAVISHFLASQGQSRPNALAPNMQQLWTRPTVAYFVRDPQSPDRSYLRVVPHITAGPSRKYHRSCLLAGRLY